MRRELFEFTWDVHKSGYHWETTRAVGQPKPPPPLKAPGQQLTEEQRRTRELDALVAKPQQFLTTGLSVNARGFAVARYSPLADYTGLFRSFAETPITPEGIQQFANRYGLLGGRHTVEIELRKKGQRNKDIGLGETFDSWQEQIFFIREAINLWDLARRGDSQRLSKFVTPRNVPGDEGVEYSSRDLLADTEEFGWYEKIASKRSSPALLEEFRSGDIIRPTQFLVQEWINRFLHREVSPRMLWDVHRTRIGLYIVPHSLIGALWLQLARAIEGDKQYRQCAACMKWFELSPDIARTNRIFCSNACRSRGYRERLQQARTLSRRQTNKKRNVRKKRGA